MSDLDLTELRQDAGDYAKFQTDPLGSYEWDQRDVRAWQAADRIESLEAERDGLMVTNERLLSYSQKAEARVKGLKARLARVTEPHVERDWRPLDGTYLGGTICNQCRRDWPCQVIRAVAADEPFAERLQRQSDDAAEQSFGTRPPADERPSFAEAIAPITKQSKQWADATKADEQEAGR